MLFVDALGLVYVCVVSNCFYFIISSTNNAAQQKEDHSMMHLLELVPQPLIG